MGPTAEQNVYDYLDIGLRGEWYEAGACVICRSLTEGIIHDILLF